jgi:hypothetical protein
MKEWIINLGLFISFFILFILVTFPKLQRNIERKWGTSDIIKIIFICTTVIAVVALLKLGQLFDSWFYKSIILVFLIGSLCWLAFILIILRDFNDKVELTDDKKSNTYDVFILFNELKQEYKFEGKISSFGKFLENKPLSRFEKPIIWTAKANTGHHLVKPLIKILSLLPDMPDPFNHIKANVRLNDYFMTSDNKRINITPDNINKTKDSNLSKELNDKFAEILKKAKVF